MLVVGTISPGDVDLREGAGVAVHAIEDLEDLAIPPFVRRAINHHLVPLLGGP